MKIIVIKNSEIPSLQKKKKKKNTSSPRLQQMYHVYLAPSHRSDKERGKKRGLKSSFHFLRCF